MLAKFTVGSNVITNDVRYVLLLADISFLLPFLRVRYFSQLEALKLLDNFLTRRTKFTKWFGKLDPGDPKMQEMYDYG